jgi:ribosomal protein S17E
MESLVRDKFKRNKELGQKLAATQSRKLINTFV